MVDRQNSLDDDLGRPILKRQRGRWCAIRRKATRKSLGVALLRLAYDAGCRRLELVAIELRHVDGPDGEGALVLPHSKTDQAEAGPMPISPATMAAHTPPRCN